jgi:hypothetical protein
MADRVVIPAKKPGETWLFPFDFISRLAVGETITGATGTCSVYSGVDATPANVVSGGNTISGTVVTQSLAGGVAGCVYDIKVVITTSLGQTLTLTAYLAITPDLP